MATDDFELPKVPVLSIDQQWKMVDRWREALVLSASELGPSLAPAHLSVDDAEIGVPCQALADLEHAWQALDKSRYFPLLADRESKTKIAHTPIEAVGEYVHNGIYPPPELLLAVRGTLRSYMDAKGEAVLEEAFFGPPKRKAGNYASRRGAFSEEFRWTHEILIATQDKTKTDIEAAQEIVTREELHIDPESLLRRVRKHWKRVPKPEK